MLMQAADKLLASHTELLASLPSQGNEQLRPGHKLLRQLAGSIAL